MMLQGNTLLERILNGLPHALKDDWPNDARVPRMQSAKRLHGCVPAGQALADG